MTNGDYYQNKKTFGFEWVRFEPQMYFGKFLNPWYNPRIYSTDLKKVVNLPCLHCTLLFVSEEEHTTEEGQQSISKVKKMFFILHAYECRRKENEAAKSGKKLAKVKSVD